MSGRNYESLFTCVKVMTEDIIIIIIIIISSYVNTWLQTIGSKTKIGSQSILRSYHQSWLTIIISIIMGNVYYRLQDTKQKQPNVQCKQINNNKCKVVWLFWDAVYNNFSWTMTTHSKQRSFANLRDEWSRHRWRNVIPKKWKLGGLINISVGTAFAFIICRWLAGQRCFAKRP